VIFGRGSNLTTTTRRSRTKGKTMLNAERALRYLITMVDSHRLEGGGESADEKLYRGLSLVRELLNEGRK